MTPLFIAKMIGNFCAGLMIGVGIRQFVEWYINRIEDEE